MFKHLQIILISLFATSTLANFPNVKKDNLLKASDKDYTKEICENLKALDLKKISSKNLKEYQKHSPKLTLFSDYHGSRYHRAHVVNFGLFKNLNPEINCNFLELPLDYNVHEEIWGKPDQNILFSIDEALLFYDIPTDYLNRQGIITINIDAPLAYRLENMKEDNSHITQKYMTKRDSHMLKNIQKAFEKESCKKGFYSVGNMHFTSGDYFTSNIYYTSLGERLKSQSENPAFYESIKIIDILDPYHANNCINSNKPFMLNRSQFIQIFGSAHGNLADYFIHYNDIGIEDYNKDYLFNLFN